MENRHSNIKGIGLMLAASVCFAIMGAAAKKASVRLSAAEIIFVRSLVSTLVLAVWISANKIPWKGQNQAKLYARGVVGFIAMYLYFWCLPKIDLGTAMMLNYTAPIFAVVISFWFFGEKLSHGLKAVILISFGGVYLVVAPQWHLEPAPLLAGLLSGCLAGIVHIVIRQTDKKDSPALIVFYFTLASTIGSALFFLSESWITPTPREWFFLSVVTIASFTGQFFMTHALKKAPVSVVSPFGYITPVLGLGLGWLLWKEIPGPMSLVGSAIVIGCGFLLYRRHS